MTDTEPAGHTTATPDLLVDGYAEPAPVDELLTTRDVAARLSVDPATVRRLIERDELVAVRVGRQLRVEPRALAAYTAAQRTTRTSRPIVTRPHA